MKKLKTNNFSLALAVREATAGNKSKRIIEVAMTDDDSPLDEPQFSVEIPAELCKSTVNNDGLTKHIVSYFIKG